MLNNWWKVWQNLFTISHHSRHFWIFGGAYNPRTIVKKMRNIFEKITRMGTLHYSLIILDRSLLWHGKNSIGLQKKLVHALFEQEFGTRCYYTTSKNPTRWSLSQTSMDVPKYHFEEDCVNLRTIYLEDK